MDGPYAATIQFKANTKNCFVSVPSSWTQHCRHDSVIVFEVHGNNGQKIFLSWSGEGASLNDSVVLNGFYALKLGLCEGEEVIVTRKRDASALESVNVEPVSVDDWEILELHTDFIQNNILNQVRVVWNNQILPVWVNQSVCILLKLNEMTPACEVGLLVNSTELHITPKSRQSQPAFSPSTTANVSVPKPAPINPSPPSTSPGNERAEAEHRQGKKWFLSSTFNNALQSLLPFKRSQDKETSAQTQSEKTDETIKEKPCKVKVSLRVHPLDTDALLEYFNAADNSDPSSNTLRMLFLQPTNVFVTSENCKLNRDKQKDPIMIGKLTNTVEIDDTSRSKKSKNENQPALKVEKHCSVKVVLLDYLLEYTEGGSDMRRLLTRLINDQTAGAVLVPVTIRRFIQCAVTTRVQLQIGTCSTTQRPTAVNLFPLNDVTIRDTDHQTSKEKEMNDQIDSWLKNICSLSCPLILFNKFIVTVPINGHSHDFIVQSPTSNVNKNNSILLATPATKFQAKWEILVKDNELTSHTVTTDWDTVNIGPPSVALGGYGSLIAESKTYLKMRLKLGPLAVNLLSGNCKLFGGLAICGSPGTGKTTMARALARDFSESPHYVYCDYISCKSMKGKRAESIVKVWKQSFKEAHRRHPAIIILDDLDQLAGVAVGPENEVGMAANYKARLADVLKELMKNCCKANVAVATVVTSTSVSSLHPALVSAQGEHLFPKVIKIPSPNINERVEILKRVILSKPLASSKVIESIEIDWSLMAAKVEGYVACDLNAIVDRALHTALLTSGKRQDDSDVNITQEDIVTATIDYVPIALRSLNIHKPGDKCWNDVGGLEDVKKTLVETLQWPSKYPNLFERCPLAMRSGVLIYGPPGTGKTLLAGVVAKECNMNFISIKGPELLSKYIGASEQAVRDLFERASNAKPCVIFFDEFDSLAPRRGHDSTGVTDRVVNQLLTQMDGVEGRKGVYILAATSRPDLIDPALLRPGRLDKCLYCGLPSAEEREQILTALSGTMTLADDVNLSLIASLCEYFSGADLQGLLYNAQMDAIHHTVGQLYSMDKSLLEMDYVICKKENSALTKTKENEYEMTHFRNLEDGPEETDADYLKCQKHKVTCILSNIEKLSTGRLSISDKDGGHRRSKVMVNQQNLLQALEEMRPSVGPEERKRYDQIYQAFIKSRGGNFDVSETPVQSLSGNRATLA